MMKSTCTFTLLLLWVVLAWPVGAQAPLPLSEETIVWSAQWRDVRFELVRGQLMKQQFEDGLNLIQWEGEFMTQNELTALGIDNIHMPFQGKFSEEIWLDNMSQFQMYQGMFHVPDADTQWLTPIEVSLQQDVDAHNLLVQTAQGNDVSHIDTPWQPLEITSYTDWVVFSPMALFTGLLGLDQTIFDDHTLTALNIFARYLPDTGIEEQIFVHPLKIQQLDGHYVEPGSTGTLVPVERFAVSFDNSLIWHGLINRDGRLVAWQLPAVPELMLWRSDLYPSGIVLRQDRQQLWQQIATWSVVAALLAIAGGGWMMRRRWLRIRHLGKAIETGEVIPEEGPDIVRQLGQAFKKLQQRTTRSEALRDRLLGDVAHELRTPVSVLRADLEALIDNVYQPSPERLMALHDKTLLLDRLVSDLHQLALAQTGDLKLSPQPTDLEDFLNSVAQTFEIAFQASDIGFNVRMKPPLPTLDLDQTRMQQVLLNLLDNARRHTPSGGNVTLSATHHTHDGQTGILISVSDTGSGISQDDLPHVFERLYRGDCARSRDRGGTGLGLSISKSFVEAHRGVIWVESKGPFQGTSIFIFLPHCLSS